MALSEVPIPYCGLPPSPEQLWSRWNLDPVLIAVLVLAGVAYWLVTSRRECRGVAPPRRQAAFYVGWAILSAALISPLCPLSVSLFEARVGQHMILVLIAAPLIMIGRPEMLLRSLIRRPIATEGNGGIGPALCATALFAALLWFWHAPGPYFETFASSVVYWTMHITLIASALWLWRVLMDRRRERAIAALAAGFITSVEMSILGAVLTLAPHPLFSPHLLTTAAWGLTPLQDQQLGGAIMWIPGGVIFLADAMMILWSLTKSDAARRRAAVSPAAARVRS